MAVGSEYLVLLLVHFGSVSGSSALFVGKLRIDMLLLIPASASENALWRDCAWLDWVEAEVE